MNKAKVISFLRSRLIGYSAFLSIGALLGTAAGLFGKFHFLFDMCTHFRLLSTPALLICGTILLIFASRKWLGAVSLAVGIGLFGSLVHYYIGKPVSGMPPDLRVMSFNVLTSNQSKQKVADYILSEDPDLVVLLEIDSAWNVSMIKHLTTVYPHNIVRTRSDNFGIGAYSKAPFKSAEIREFGFDVTPSVDLYIGSVRVIGTHPVPPTNREYWESRNLQLKTIAEEVAKSEVPTIVCGDLNCTPWCPFMKQFLEISGLHDSAKGFGLKPTWSAFGGLVGMPIDHVFYSKDLKVIDRKIGPGNGSDHKPVVVDVLLQ